MFHEKSQQAMPPSTRNFYLATTEEFLDHFIELMPFIVDRYYNSIDMIYKEVKKFRKIHFKISTDRTLPWICLERKKINIFGIFLSCEDDVNKTDKNNETILHYLLDSKIFCKRRLIKSVVDAGFDFSRVTSSKYCLPCRMKKEGFSYYPKECNTLQCLAANVICQKTVLMGTDIPFNLWTIIKTHMHIP